MTTDGKRRRTGGWMLVELLVGMSVTAMVLASLAAVRAETGRLVELLALKQQCLSAARGQLDTLAATGEAMPAEQVRRLWPKVSLAVQHTAGEGDWLGLTRVSVTAAATARPGQRTVRVELTRYLPGEGGR